MVDVFILTSAVLFLLWSNLTLFMISYVIGKKLRRQNRKFKKLVYEMRFDEVSAKFAEFGDFYIGIQQPLDELFRRVCL